MACCLVLHAASRATTHKAAEASRQELPGACAAQYWQWQWQHEQVKTEKEWPGALFWTDKDGGRPSPQAFFLLFIIPSEIQKILQIWQHIHRILNIDKNLFIIYEINF